MTAGIRAVTVVTGSLPDGRRLYEGLLGMRPVAEWRAGPGTIEASRCAAAWGLPTGRGVEGVWLQQPGATEGAVRLLAFEPGSSTRVVDGARPYDYGYVKNLDFFTDDVEGAYQRFVAAGRRFLSPPVRYAVPWGRGVTAIEAHLPTDDGVKISLASLSRAPRRAFGTAGAEAAFTEVAAATQIVSDFERAVRFYCDVFDCVPAAETVIADPPLVAALGLPHSTRLRLCFIGPPRAVGGKVGLVAYEGPGVADARPLWRSAPPWSRGVLSLTFETDDVDGCVARAILHGATMVMPPGPCSFPAAPVERAATVRSPDGILLEIVTADGSDAGFVPLVEDGAVPEGALVGVARPDIGRVVLARVGGQVFALEDRCPHLGGPLSRGDLRGRHVTCPWHGWVVDVTTGRVAGGDGLAARRCSLRRVEGLICARLGPAVPAPVP